MKGLLKISGFGTWLALLCGIHCALTPIVIAVTPVMAGSLLNAEWLEMLLIGSGFLFAGITVGRAYLRHHGKFQPVLIVLTGLLIAACGWLLLSHSWQHLTTFIGAGMLIAAQVQNVRFSRRCACVRPA
jgi:hypothetical protein